MTTREEVGKRIRQAREAVGLSQTELGAAMNRKRSHAAISDMERGTVRLDVEELAEVAKILRTDIQTLLEPSASVIWRRGEYAQTHDQKQETRQAIEAFQAHARSLATKKPAH